MLHIGLHGGQTVMRHHAAQLLRPFFIRCNLGFQVRHVLRRVATRVRPTLQQSQHLRFTQHTFFHQFEILNLHTLFIDGGGKRWHRAWGHTANVCVVATRAHIKIGLKRIAQINRRDDGHIGQMGSPVVGVVQNIHIAGLHSTCVISNHRFDALAHRAQMHRHVWGIGNQLALLIEDGT